MRPVKSIFLSIKNIDYKYLIELVYKPYNWEQIIGNTKNYYEEKV